MKNKQNGRDDEWRLDELHDLLMQKIVEEFSAGRMSEADVGPAIRRAVDEAAPEAAQVWLTALRGRRRSMLNEHRSLNRGFIKRNIRRWRPGFDALEVLIVACEEAGEAVNRMQRPAAAASKNYRFEAMTGLHGRSVLVAREIYCLMQAGFADGALGRWKTLHELAVVANFLQLHDQSVSERYLLHRTVRMAKAAEQYKEYEAAAGLEPFDLAELKQLVEAREAICVHHGTAMREDRGWAATALGKEKRITFFDIEKDAKLDHWRPRYRWASQDTHGNFRPSLGTLAMCESSEQAIVVGPSNSGMVDPAQMVAHALVMATLPLLMLEPNFDRLATMRVLEALRGEVGEAFMTAEKDSLEAYEKGKYWLIDLPGQITVRLRTIVGWW